MRKFDDLPLEVYRLIFENYLDLVDLFSLALVSKKVHFIVSQCRVRELIFENNYKYRYNWFGTSRSIDYKCVLDKSKLFTLNKRLFNIDCLLRLKIDNLRDNYKITLKHISQFVKLEILEIFLDQCQKQDNRKLCLPNLRVLSFTSNYKYTAVDLNLPKLDTLDLNCYSIDSIKFSNPLTVKRLKVYDFMPELAQFANLEYFECFSSIQNAQLLSMFANLKELQIENDQFKMLSQILRQKAKLERDDLKVFFQSYQLETVNDLNYFRRDLYYFYNGMISVQMNKYSHLADNLDWVDEINYSHLMQLVIKLPLDFFEKYCNIQKLYVYGSVKDPEHLKAFISNCRNLGHLRIDNGHLEQTWFDRLPEISLLTELEIYEDLNVQLNFNFIGRMFYLKEFKTDLDTSLSLIRALEKAKHLKQIQSTINKIHVCVEKFRGDKYYLKDVKNSGFFNEMFNFDELIKSFDYLNSSCSRPTRSKFKKLKAN